MSLMGWITDKAGLKNKYHQNEAQLDQSQYGGTIGQATANQQQVFGQQQQMNDTLGQQANGLGPNPAKEMLKQQTAQNVNMAAGQAASQRGVNPALAGRMAVDAGAQMNQQAAGQGATLGAQQSLAARQLQAQNQQAMGQQQMGMLGTAGQLQNSQNNARIANTLGAGQINAGVAAQNQQTSNSLFGGLMNAAGGALSMIPFAEGGEVPGYDDGGSVLPSFGSMLGSAFRSVGHAMAGQEDEGTMPSFADKAVKKVTEEGDKNNPLSSAGGEGGGGGAAAGIGALAALNKGGRIPGFFLGSYVPGSGAGADVGSYMDSLDGMTGEAPQQHEAPLAPAPTSAPGPAQAAKKGPTTGQTAGKAAGALGASLTNDAGLAAYDRFMRMRIPGTMSEGGPVPTSFKGGGHVPGAAPVAGDSPKNDTVPAYLSPGEVVIPRSIAQSPDAPQQAARFVDHIMRSKGGDAFSRIMAARKYAEGGEVDPAQAQALYGALDANSAALQNDGDSVTGIPAGYDEGGTVQPQYTAVQDPANFQRRIYPPVGPTRRPDQTRTPEVPEPDFYTGDSEKVKAKRAAQGKSQKLADGGEVEGEKPPQKPGLLDAVKGWWAAPSGTPEADKAREAVVDATHEALPDWLSARKAIEKKRERMKQIDDATKE